MPLQNVLDQIARRLSVARAVSRANLEKTTSAQGQISDLCRLRAKSLDRTGLLT
jgi:hypothetical protein